MKTVKHISYSELRCFSEKIMSFVRNETLEYDISLSSRIEGDCRIAGDDIDELLMNFSTKFGVDLSELKFEEHFYLEGEGWQFFPLSILIISFMLVFDTLDLLLKNIVNFRLKGTLKLDKIMDRIYGKGRKDLMVKDLVVSAIFKKFQLKKEVIFVLTN